MIEETMQSEMKPMLVKRASTIGKEYQEVIIGHNSMFKNEFQKSFELAISLLKFQPNFCQASLPKQSKHKRTLVLELEGCLLITSLFQDQLTSNDGNFVFNGLRIFVQFRA